ncbi:hypothetical protein THAOC_07060 [Thalassiosira oceanica]|uniref:Uncharacterized protein n=1 Tax=Thalassiosira oceanica TaxID=159749 RepID=K0T174_THAOC|nr:hypothetical protein THAOC_07060 [Thalassiosira oceanica]|eukprot:EJK71495.1 hypothetical protein THAOC_07060 [Thalassiosira oceanica]
MDDEEGEDEEDAAAGLEEGEGEEDAAAGLEEVEGDGLPGDLMRGGGDPESRRRAVGRVPSLFRGTARMGAWTLAALK